MTATMKRFGNAKLGMTAAVIVVLSIPAYLRTAQTAPTPIGDTRQENATVVRIVFGVRRFHPKTWDGEISLDRGSVVRLSGVYFEQEDAILGPNRWTCTSRATVYMDSRSPRGYDPVHTKAWELIPNGVVAVLRAPADASAEVKTASGTFSFRLDQLSLGHTLSFLDGDVSVELLPPSVALTVQPGENDYPALATDSRGDLWASWISYANRADGVWAAHRGTSGWEPPSLVSGSFADNFRTALAEDAAGRMWVVWSAHGENGWGIYGRWWSGGRWSPVERLTDDGGPNLYHTLVRDARGKLHLVWQGFRNRRSEILMKTWDGNSWSREVTVGGGPGDNWAPSAAADSKGNLWIGWDGYESGNFDVFVRRWNAAGQLEERRRRHQFSRVRRQCVARVRPGRPALDRLGCRRDELGEGLDEPAFRAQGRERTLPHPRRPGGMPRRRPADATRRRYHASHTVGLPGLFSDGAPAIRRLWPHLGRRPLAHELSRARAKQLGRQRPLGSAANLA